MEAIFLKWDSAFFQQRIYKAVITEKVTEEDLYALQQLDAGLVYIYVEEIAEQTHRKLEEIGALLIDKKVTYEKNVVTAGAGNYNVSFQSATELTPAIEDMAYQSGIYSRFRLDPKLTFKFREMYHTWIVKSLNREMADEVMIAIDNNGEAAGFVTLANKGTYGAIGLIAVDSKFRGQGIGSQLLNKSDEWYVQNGIGKCEVVTQVDNIPACSLYEKAGYSKKRIEYIYHYWKA